MESPELGLRALLGGGIARAQSPSEIGRCNRPCQAVAPPKGSVSELPGGCTALVRRWYRQDPENPGDDIFELQIQTSLEPINTPPILGKIYKHREIKREKTLLQSLEFPTSSLSVRILFKRGE